MNPLLVRLLLMSIRGRLVRWVRLLRQPKYLVGFVIGAGYVAFWMLRFAVGDDGAFFGGRGSPAELGSLMHSGLSLVLLGYVSGAWLLPWGKLGLPLKEAELLMLLPAPLARRDVIHYALLKSQGGILFGAFLLSVFTGTGRPAEQVRLLAALWLTFTLIDLNQKGRALFLLRQGQISPGAALRRRVAVVALAVAPWPVLATSVWSAVAPVLNGEVAGPNAAADVTAALASVLREGWSAVVLTPFRWLVAPAFASSWSAFAVAALPGIAAVVLVHEAVVRSKARFEEPALQHARDRARRTSRTWRFLKMSRKARRANAFRLSPFGRPEIAVVWKNLHQFSRTPFLRLAATWFATLAAVSVSLAAFGVPGRVLTVLAILGLALSVGLPLFVTLGMRNDLQGDLAHLELVGTWPVSPHRLAAAEMLGPSLLGTSSGVLGGSLCVAAFAAAHLGAVWRGPDPSLPWPLRPGSELLEVPALLGVVLALVGLVPVLAAGTALLSSVRNLGVLAFPGWFGIGQAPGRGMAVFGQQMLLGSAFLLSLLIGMVPAAAVVGALLLAQHLAGLPWTAWAFPVWGLAGAAPVFVEVAVVVRIAGAIWSRLDPSREILESQR